MATDQRACDIGSAARAQLRLILSDELTFAILKAEQPDGTVLLPVSSYASEYELKDWDTRMARRPVVIDFPGTGMNPRDLILGIRLESGSRAFPHRRVITEKLVKDRVATEPVLLVVGPDGESVRAFAIESPASMVSPIFIAWRGIPELR